MAPCCATASAPGATPSTTATRRPTGRWYFMEEVQFATTCNYLGNGDNAALRTGSQGLVQTCVDAWQTRSCAWDWRARVQALCVTPDADTALRNEFIASAQYNI